MERGHRKQESRDRELTPGLEQLPSPTSSDNGVETSNLELLHLLVQQPQILQSWAR